MVTPALRVALPLVMPPHDDRITKPMIRDSIDQPWQEVSWEEALSFASSKLKGIQEKYGRESIGGITSSPLY